MTQSFLKNFLRGLLVVAPVAVTLYIAYFLFATVDSWVNIGALLDRRIPGAGVVLTIGLITFIGFLASNMATRWMFRSMDRLFARVPLLKLIYTSLKDLIEAFVGDKKRFDKPVLVSLGAADLNALGFLTRENLTGLGLPGHVAVYFPQSYNFAGQMLVVPRDRVQRLPVDSTTAMTFIISGGVSGDLLACLVSGTPVAPSPPGP